MILVTGATGTIGRHLVRMLTEAGAPLRALVRDAARGRDLGCDVVVGDFDEPATLAAAFEGVDALLLNSGGALPVAGRQPMVRQQAAAVDAARAASVRHVVKVSAWRPGPESKLSVRAHWEIEQHLTSSGVPWSTLRPTGFMQNFFTGKGGFAGDGAVRGPYGSGRVAYVDAYDVAACAAVLLTDPAGARRRTYDITGPEALDHAEIAAKLGVPLHAQTPAEAAAQLRAEGLPDWFVTDLLWLYADMASGGLSEVTTVVNELTGRPPRTFDAFLADRAA